MDFLELQSFVVICDCKNITEAARRLYITQPALSRRIQDMERELGVTLFVRKSKGIEITEAGHSLYHDAVRLLAQRQAFSEKVESLRSGTIGEIRISASPYWPRLPLMRCISALSVTNPQISLSFNYHPTEDVPRLLLQGDLDVALCDMADLDGISTISYEVLHESAPSILVGRNHRFWNRDRISMEDLSGETVWVYSSSLKNVASAAILYLKRSCPSIRNIFACTSPEDGMFYAISGRSVSLCCTYPGEWLPEARDLVRNIPVDCPDLQAGAMVAAYTKGNIMATSFIELLKKEYHQGKRAADAS